MSYSFFTSSTFFSTIFFASYINFISLLKIFHQVNTILNKVIINYISGIFIAPKIIYKIKLKPKVIQGKNISHKLGKIILKAKFTLISGMIFPNFNYNLLNFYPISDYV